MPGYVQPIIRSNSQTVVVLSRDKITALVDTLTAAWKK